MIKKYFCDLNKKIKLKDDSNKIVFIINSLKDKVKDDSYINSTNVKDFKISKKYNTIINIILVTAGSIVVYNKLKK